MEGIILIVGIALAYYLAKLGKTAVQGVAIWMVTIGAFPVSYTHLTLPTNREV